MKILFNEIQVRDFFIDFIKEVYNENYDILNTEVSVIPSENQEPSFPSVIVSVINPTSNTKYVDNESTYNKINLSINCEIVSKKLDNYTLEDSIIILKDILIGGVLQKISTLSVTRDNNVPYRTDAKRRIVTFGCVYDTINNKFYLN